jgi:hypothetical protein
MDVWWIISCIITVRDYILEMESLLILVAMKQIIILDILKAYKIIL